MTSWRPKLGWLYLPPPSFLCHGGFAEILLVTL